MKTRIWWGWGVLAASCLGAALGLSAAEPSVPLAAKGKGFEVTQQEVDQWVVEQKALMERGGQKVTRAMEARIEAQALERLIGRRVIALRATDADRTRAREVVKQTIAQEIAKVGSEDTFRRQLLVAGTQPEVFEARLLEQAVADQVINREIKSRVTISDDQVRAFYETGDDLQSAEVKAVADRLAVKDSGTVFYRDATNRLAEIRAKNLARLERPAEARAIILVMFRADPLTGKPLTEAEIRAKRERMERLLEQTKSGADFGKLAQEHSEEPDAAQFKAEYVARRSALAPELAEAMFGLPLHQVSGVITTAMGYYAVKVLERREAAKAPYAEAEAGIRDLLASQEAERRLPGWIAELRKEAEVTEMRR